MKKTFVLLFFLGFMLSGNAQNPLEDYYSRIEKPFSSISDKYTLLLSAKIDDCGEFGGHLETIEIKKIENKLSAIISIYDENCDGQWKLEEEKIISSKTYPVSDNDLIELENYLTTLMKLSLREEVPHHAGSYFIANLQYRTNSDYKNQRINLRYHDSNNEWNEFERLKNKLKK